MFAAILTRRSSNGDPLKIADRPTGALMYEEGVQKPEVHQDPLSLIPVTPEFSYLKQPEGSHLPDREVLR
ncbi:MAG: hypothetical protein WBD58_18255 [Geitlerinemataceae cyanobacterium]